MNLKQRFLTQTMMIFLVTIIITVCAGFVYNYFYNLLQSTAPGVLKEASVIVMEDQGIIYNNENFSKFQIKEMLMNISIGKNYYDIDGIKYSTKSEKFTALNGDYTVLTLVPTGQGNYYKGLMLIVFSTFFICFAVVSIVVQKKNNKNIIIPIINLTRETEKLRKGQLETAITEHGFGEIKELEIAVEQLRLELKNSIYHQQKSDENRKFLISSISHDLKTPVTSIRGYIEGVIDKVADTDERKEYYLLKAVDKTKLISTMIEDLLLYSKLDLNQMSFEKQNVDINKYMESCIDDSIREFGLQNKLIILQNKLTKRYFVTIDNEKFKRVVQNIVDNARANIEEKGLLKIILRETNSSVIIEFKDNGKGIAKEDLPQIFDRFYRADIARTVEGSSGLGLAISKQIVEGLKGRIWAISEAGQGTSIMISLKKSM